MKNQSTIARIAWGICLLVGVVLSLKALREPDLWWMYRTGEWMLENGQVTKTDPFSYTFAGTEWINVKWLWEVIIASGKNLFGVEFIFVFQAIVVVLILTFFFKSANLIKKHTTQEADYENKPFAGLVIVGLLLLFTIDYRMIGRPEMTSHLMVTIYLYLFWRYYYEPSKVIFALIPLQILWTNMHEAFGIGLVLMLAYLGASWVQYFYDNKMQKEVAKEIPKLLSIAVLGAIIGIVINPRGYQMWLHPFEIFSQLESNQYTTELASIWKAVYWEKQAYLNLFFLGASLLFVIITPMIYRASITREETVKVPQAKGKGKKSKAKAKTKSRTVTEQGPLNWFGKNVSKYGMGNGLLYFMLFYLSTTAYRNIPFFVIASAPILAVAVDHAFKKINYPKWVFPLSAGLAALFYVMVISGKYHEWTKSRDTYGLQVLSSHNPVGAAQFIQDNNIKGLCFSDYLTSAYLLWKMQPDFKTYIDLRDLDIFPTEFFTEFAQIANIPPVFEAKDDSLNFDYVVLFRPQFTGLHKHLLESTEYELVFVDPVACVYMKNNDANQEVIQKYGFTRNGFKDMFSPLQQVESSTVPYLISKIFNPFYTPTDYSETDIFAIAGSYYLSMQQNNLAIAKANESIQKGVEPWKGNDLLGNIYNNKAFAATTNDSLRQVYMQQASYCYGQAIAAKPDYVSAIVGKGTLFMQQQDFNAAIHQFRQAIAIDPNYAQALQYLGMCYKFLANQNGNDVGNTQEWLNYMLRLNRINPDNPVILLDIGIAYCYLGNCPKSVEYLEGIMGVQGLPPEEYKTAVRCMKNCGG